MLADIEILPFNTLLGIFDRLRDQPVLDRLPLFHADSVHDGGDPLRPEDPQEVVFQREVEAGRPHVPLASRTSAELVVDPAAFVPLRPQDMETPEVGHPLAQFDVRSAPCHVGRDGHLAGLSGLSDDLRFPFMIFCI